MPSRLISSLSLPPLALTRQPGSKPLVYYACITTTAPTICSHDVTTPFPSPSHLSLRSLLRHASTSLAAAPQLPAEPCCGAEDGSAAPVVKAGDGYGVFAAAAAAKSSSAAWLRDSTSWLEERNLFRRRGLGRRTFSSSSESLNLNMDLGRSLDLDLDLDWRQ
jgi:hypothetical protein